MSWTKRRISALTIGVAALTATLVVGTGPATADPSISSKRDQAQAILGQIREMDSDLSHAIEAYNLANVQLDQIDNDLETNGRHLVVAKSSLSVAQDHIAKRLRALYINGDAGGAVEVILGAKSLDDLLDRLDMAERVGGQDSQVLKDVRRFRNEVQTRRAKLRSDRSRQAQIVSERASREALDRRAARGTAAAARLGEGRDRAARGRRGAPAGAARGSGPRTTGGGCRGAFVRQAADPRGVLRSGRRRIRTSRRLRRPRSTAAWSGSRCSTSASRTSGAARARRASTARASPSYVYAQIGVSLPHNAAMQYNSVGVFVSRDQLAAGDLVFFDGLGHTGMYIGGGQFIHAPHTGDVVKISSLNDSWYASTYVGAKRVT